MPPTNGSDTSLTTNPVDLEQQKSVIEIATSPSLHTAPKQLQYEPYVHHIFSQQAESLELSRLQQRLHELSAHLLSIRDEERIHIAHSIHDELGQALIGLKLDIAWLQKHLDQPQHLLVSKIQTISEQIDKTIQAVRQIATELRPAVLNDLDLVAALNWYVQEFQVRTGIQSTFKSTIKQSILDAARATATFRIFQEALTNVAHHAQATQVEIVVEETTHNFMLQVHDNGRGIPEQALNSLHSLGLLGMYERARQLGGEVQIQSSSGHGTTITVELPQKNSYTQSVVGLKTGEIK